MAEGVQENSFFDDLADFGSGALDSIEESFGNILGSLFPPPTTSNPNATQQPNQGAVDNNGNAVTVPQGNAGLGMSNNTLLLVGGGIGLLILILIVVLATKK